MSNYFRFMIVVLVVILLVGCHSESINTNKDIKGTWIGGGYEMDLDTYQPIPTILTFTDEQLILKNNTRIDTLSYSFSEAPFLIDQSDTLFLDEFKIQRDQLKFKIKYFNNYHRCKKSDLSFSKTKEDLVNKYWSSDDETILFDGSYFFVSKKNDKAFKKLCYNLEKVNSSIIINKYGDFLDCTTNHQYLEQIIDLDENKLTILRWEKDGFKEISFQLDKSPKELTLVDFQLCNIYLNVNHPRDRYYAGGTSYQGGLYKIRKVFTEKYIPPRNVKENGLIRIRFIVNCQGDAGQFEILELDKNYKEKKMDERISSQILNITKSLKEWIPGKRNEKPIDSYKFLTFKIKDSEIKEIFP